MLAPPQVQNAKGLRWSGRTDRGKVRTNNEDAFLGLQFDGREVRHLGKIGEGLTGQMDYAFAVSDGMGGAMAGEIASRIAIEKITTLLPRAYRQSAAGLDAGITDVLEELFTQIHRSLAQMGRSYEECRGMETTLSLAWFTPGKMYFAHVGDSRIYYLPSQTGPIKQLTQDDTHVGWLLRNGHLKEWEARSHPARNRLQKALGGNNQFVTPQVGAVPYEPGDVFLLCTDGLTEGLFDQDLHDFLRVPEAGENAIRPAERLVNESLDRSGRDNTTALVIGVY